MSDAKYPTLDYAESHRTFLPRRPSSVWVLLLWLLVAALFYALISYGLVHWWQKPVPTDLPPPPSTTNTRTS